MHTYSRTGRRVWVGVSSGGVSVISRYVFFVSISVLVCVTQVVVPGISSFIHKRWMRKREII